MNFAIEDRGEVDIRSRGLEPQKMFGALEYVPTDKFGKLRWYILDKAGRVIESLVSVERVVFRLEISGVKYNIPVLIDTINLDDRDFSGSDRALIFYVKGYPELQHRLDGKKKNNALYEDALEGFRGYLENVLKRIQRGETVEEKFQILSSFRSK